MSETDRTQTDDGNGQKALADETVLACPDCRKSECYQRISERFDTDERWRCRNCGATFASPAERPTFKSGRGATGSSVADALENASPDEPLEQVAARAVDGGESA